MSPAARAAFLGVAAAAVVAVLLTGSTPPPLREWQWWLAKAAGRGGLVVSQAA